MFGAPFARGDDGRHHRRNCIQRLTRRLEPGRGPRRGPVVTHARLKSELLARIECCEDGEQRKQVRAAITTAEESGSLAGPALGDVKEKYNERFAKKSDSLSANLREPGEEG